MATKESLYKPYCQYCKYAEFAESEDPCNLCLSWPVNIDSRKPLCYDGSYTMPKSDMFYGYNALQRLKFALYEAEVNKLDYEYAENYLLSKGEFRAPGACSAFVYDGKLARNFDWFYDSLAEFVVKTPRTKDTYAVLGVCGGVNELSDAVVGGRRKTEAYRLAPFLMRDGMNEHGLVIEENVVPKDYGEVKPPKESSKKLVSCLMLNRFLLDHCKSAEEAVKTVKNDIQVYFATSLHKMDYELHYLIADEKNSYILEFVNGEPVIIDCKKDNVAPVITNFHVSGVDFNSNGTVYTPATSDATHDAIRTNNVSLHGAGLERYNMIRERMNEGNVDIWELLRDLRYTRMYSTNSRPSEPFWYTEYVSPNGLTVANRPEDFANVVEKTGMIFSHRARNDGLTWQTTHSAVYNIAQKSVDICTQESDEMFRFKV